MNLQIEQKILHFVLYNQGHAGMCNLLVSVQNAVLIAQLTQREHIVFYTNVCLFNSVKKLTVFNLFNIQFSYSLKVCSEYPTDILQLPTFENCCFYYGDSPGISFSNGRHAFDLGELLDVKAFGTDTMTLGYYSYLFFLSHPLRDDLVKFVKAAVNPKAKYLEYARNFRDRLGPYHSLHFRRGDFLAVQGAANATVTWDEMMPNLTSQLDKNVMNLIHTDETDEAYFKPMVDAGYQLHFFEKELAADLDDAEKGLVSILVAAGASKFIGTMLSTFTGYIHQYRRQRGDVSGFKYLYSQIPTVKLKNAEVVHSLNGEYTWNRITLSQDYKNTLAFIMEHHECYPNEDLIIDNSLKVYPLFLTAQEIHHFSTLFESKSIVHHCDEKRNQAIVCIDQDYTLKNVVQRITQTTGMQSEIFVNSMQIIKQVEGGETQLHCDSLTSAIGEPRRNIILLYLNDDYTGGYEDYPYLQTKICPSKGMMVCYPVINKYGEQMPQFTHAGSDITKGHKLVCYLATQL
jgi:hypothetical protein